jgi:dolichol-phosphate mannosyltransferase
MALAGGTVPFRSASRFAAAGMAGVLTDVLLFQLFTSLGASLALAHMASFFAAAALNYFLDSKWSFRPRHADDQ